MAFNVKSLGSLLGKDARSLIPKDAKLLASSDHPAAVHVDPKYNVPLLAAGYHEDVFDLDGDGEGDVVRRNFGDSVGLEFKDKSGDRLLAYANPRATKGESDAPERIFYTVANIGSEQKFEADYDGDGKADATLTKPR